MKKIMLMVGVLFLAGCASSPMEQKEYKSRLDYCSKNRYDSSNRKKWKE